MFNSRYDNCFPLLDILLTIKYTFKCGDYPEHPLLFTMGNSSGKSRVSDHVAFEVKKLFIYFLEIILLPNSVAHNVID